MPTTNNNWPTPVATDLVKDGWEAIKDLGDAIDTTLGVYAPSTPGLTLINTTSFSGVSSISLPANTFTSTYTNYRIMFQNISTANSTNFVMRLRASGSDNSTSNYDVFAVYGQSTTASAGGGDNDSSWGLGVSNTQRHIITIDLFNPQTSDDTFFLGQMWQSTSDAGTLLVRGGRFQSGTSFDSLSFIPNGGTLATGQYSVYGYSK